MSLKNNIAAGLVDTKSEIMRLFNNYSPTLDDEDKGLIEQIKAVGYAVLPSYLSADYCKKAIQEIDELLESPDINVNIDSQGSDHRLYGANLKSEIIKDFYTDDRINRILQAYEGTTYKDGFTLAAKMVFKDGNIGSGGGWHRDSASTKQTKAIAYLTDVDEDNGPFEYLNASHKRLNMLQILTKHQIDLNTTRFPDAVMQEILKNATDQVTRFTAKAGTVILVNTRGLHRGTPIQKGVRYALTNYNWTDHMVPPHIKKYF